MTLIIFLNILILLIQPLSCTNFFASKEIEKMSWQINWNIKSNLKIDAYQIQTQSDVFSLKEIFPTNPKIIENRIMNFNNKVFVFCENPSHHETTNKKGLIQIRCIDETPFNLREDITPIGFFCIHPINEDEKGDPICGIFCKDCFNSMYREKSIIKTLTAS